MFLPALKVCSLQNPCIETHSLKAWVSSNAGDSSVICFTYLCHNPSNFLAVNTLSTSYYKITTAALMPVAIERFLYEAAQQRHVPFTGVGLLRFAALSKPKKKPNTDKTSTHKVR